MFGGLVINNTRPLYHSSKTSSLTYESLRKLGHKRHLRTILVLPGTLGLSRYEPLRQSEHRNYKGQSRSRKEDERLKQRVGLEENQRLVTEAAASFIVTHTFDTTQWSVSMVDLNIEDKSQIKAVH